MQVVIKESAQAVAHIAAKHCIDTIANRTNCVLGLATGSTPTYLYKELIRQNRKRKVSFNHCHTFNLDEYVGLSPEHAQSYRHFMNEHLFDHININPTNTHVPSGIGDAKQEADNYEALISHAGGIDLQILGIGINGHIGFNEPGSSLVSRTRIKALAWETIESNQRFFKADELQPILAITMGIGTILEADKILLLATGSNKSKAIKALIEGPITDNCPASALQKHGDTTIIIDRQAAAELEHTIFCNKTYRQIEDWNKSND